jgi:hypothetical protein
MKKKTTITLETWEVVTLWQGREAKIGLCPRCGSDRAVLSLAEAATIIGIPEEEVLAMFQVREATRAAGGGSEA